MIEVEILRSGSPSRRVRLGDGAFAVGRHQDNDVILDAKEVSRHHARLLLESGQIIIEDLSSGNGVFVEGRPVQTALVEPGSRVELANYSLVFHDLRPEPAQADAVWTSLDGASAGTRWSLEGMKMTIGRDDTRDISIRDPGVSRHHATLVRRDYGWAVRDEGSANGLFLNEQKLKDAPLRDGDIVRIGHCRFRFSLEEPPSAAEQGAEKTVVMTTLDLDAMMEQTRQAPAPKKKAPAAPKDRTWLIYAFFGVLCLAVLVALVYVSSVIQTGS